MPDRPTHSLGDALELCYETAISDWRRMYAPSVAFADLLAGPIVSIAMQTLIIHAGRANITITINARRHHQTDAFFFIAERHEGLWTFPDQDLANPQR